MMTVATKPPLKENSVPRFEGHWVSKQDYPAETIVCPLCWLPETTDEYKHECHCVSNQQCAGSGIYRGNVCKSPRDPSLLVLPPNRTLVFSSPNEFRAHHRITAENEAGR